MRIHRNICILGKLCLFYKLLFITNHITDVLSDLSRIAMQVRAEPWVENGTDHLYFLKNFFFAFVNNMS